MSIYKKFIDSSAAANQDIQMSAKVIKSAPNHIDQLGIEMAQRRTPTQNMLHIRQKSCIATGRAPVVRLSPQTGSPLGGSNTGLAAMPTTTPKSCLARNTYERMVPAEEFKHHNSTNKLNQLNYHEKQQQQLEYHPLRERHISSLQIQAAAPMQPATAHHHQLSSSPINSHYHPHPMHVMHSPQYQKLHHHHHKQQRQQQMAASCYSLNSYDPQQQLQQLANNPTAAATTTTTTRESCYSTSVSSVKFSPHNTNSTNMHPNPNLNLNYQQLQRRRPVFVQPIAPPASPPVAMQAQEAQAAALRENVFKTDDPVLLKWLKEMRFEAELECLSELRTQTLAIDGNLAGALSVRNSQVAIQEMRQESDYILELTNILIEMLPINLNTIDRFAVEFSNLWALLVRQTEAQTRNAKQNTHTNYQNNLTIVNCTPRKSLASARTLRPLDDLSIKIRAMCIEMANSINQHQENSYSNELSELQMDNGNFEAVLRRIKELYGKFVEISIRAECANIVRALRFDFSSQKRGMETSSNNFSQTLGTSKLENVSSTGSLRPVRVYQSSARQLPLKWALIALWQLTKDDGYICRLLTEMWQTGDTLEETSDLCNERTPAAASANGSNRATRSLAGNSVAKRLDYSTKYEESQPISRAQATDGEQTAKINSNATGPMRCEKPLEICQRFCENQQVLLRKQQQRENSTTSGAGRSGALSSALKSKHEQAARRQLSTIELLIDIIISQPNKHERVDMLNFMQKTKLVDVEELDQSVSAALYTSNQYKVAALRILNQLCINEQAVKTILKCFSTPPPKQGHQVPQNKIIKSIFECYQTAQEHIYQNETMFTAPRTPARSRKRARQVLDQLDCDENSDYGSRQTNSVPTSESQIGCELDKSSNDENDDDDDDKSESEGDDAVVKEAIRLLIQLTAPFHRTQQGHDYYTLIGRFSIESLVKYLTNIIKTTNNREMVLLSLSALANISFITTEPMRLFNTSSIVLNMFQSSKARSKDLEMRDQTVTILANMAESKNSLDLVGNGNELKFLLSCLETCPSRMANFKLVEDKQLAIRSDLTSMAGSSSTSSSTNHYARISGSDSSADGYTRLQSRSGYGQIDNKPRDRKPIQMSDEFIEDLDCLCDNQRQTNMPMMCLSRLRPSELAAMERIHQKTAVAFARLASDLGSSQMVLRYGGVKQMIDLCKLSNKRNHSDTVLIACLAALRKMAKVIGHETFRHYNALDLIELELNQALEIYGRLYASEV